MRFNNHKIKTSDYKRARELRKSSSSIEHKLWTALQSATSDGKIKFRRQQPIPPYIVDFACMKARLVIEVDGMSHDSQIEYDQEREKYIEQQGFVILRFANDDVAKDSLRVVETILAKAKELLPMQAPPHQ